jgi:hypothetical protein
MPEKALLLELLSKFEFMLENRPPTILGLAEIEIDIRSLL